MGFAESDCDFSELAPQGVKVPQSPLPTTWPTPEPFMPPEWAPSGPCDAMCDVEDSPVPYSQLGAQTWVNKNDGVTTVDRTCTIHCAEDHSIYFSSFADLNCSSKVDDVWSICSEACQQSKPSWALTDKGLCGKEQVATRDCYAEGCPILAGDAALVAYNFKSKHFIFMKF